MPKIDLTGRHFTKWTVLGYSHYDGCAVYWNCRCVCGHEQKVSAGHLVQGHSRGCLKCRQWIIRDRQSPDATLRRIFHLYQKRARKHHREWVFSFDDFKNLVHLPCIYCGAIDDNFYRFGTAKFAVRYNGIDRQNNSEGYTVKNSVPCCGICNRAKKTLTHETFLSYLTRVKDFQLKKDSK
jgi:hypothetical protein